MDPRLDRSQKIYIAGHRGLAGSAIWRHLQERGFTALAGATSGEVDLRDREATRTFFERDGIASTYRRFLEHRAELRG